MSDNEIVDALAQLGAVGGNTLEEIAAFLRLPGSSIRERLSSLVMRGYVLKRSLINAPDRYRV